jgi:hypothetical protein
MNEFVLSGELSVDRVFTWLLTYSVKVAHETMVSDRFVFGVDVLLLISPEVATTDTAGLQHESY